LSPESIKFLDENRGHYEILERAGYVKHLDIATREGLLNVIRKEWDPGYLSNNWCGECVANMLKFAYLQYDKWIQSQPKP
jgi:hypothetical protein